MVRIISWLLLCLAVLGTAALRGEAVAQQTEAEEPVGTPARLSYTDGEVSFWRAGAPDWSRAVINTPLAPGDELATAAGGTLEIQLAPRAFVRAWTETHLGLSSQEPDFLQFKVTAGHASFDLRALDPGETVEVDTPNAAITIEHPGYYRVEIAGERTSIITRRGGRATVTPASGESIAMLPSEELLVEGSDTTQATSYAAPPKDEWDGWNYARTNSLIEAVSARYVPPGTLGVDELDRYGTWRVVPEYGPLWIPAGIPAGWSPYSTGSWVMDPYYGWTWVSSMRWGWAPFHHGRWVFVDRYWAWSPGPVVARAVYAPALVAFLGTPPVGVGVSAGAPLVGWVALGWGEPCIPWWGPAGFAHRPWWGGWGGPRVVNTVVVNQTTVVNVQNITVYRNTTVTNAVVMVNHEHFGRGPITEARVRQPDIRTLHPLHTGVPVQPTGASWAASSARGARPSDVALHRPIVATRSPRPLAPSVASGPRPVPAETAHPATRIVSVTPSAPATTLARPAFGQSPRERGTSDREIPPRPPRKPASQAKVHDQGGARAASIPNAALPAPQGSPAGASGGTPTPGSKSGPSAASTPVGSGPSRPEQPQASVGGSSYHGGAAPSGSPPPVSQAVPKRYGGKAPLPGEPANKLAPHRVEGPRPKEQKPSADQPAKKQ